MSPLVATLRAVAAGMRDVADPWWIIGSAAVVLHGGDTIVADVDVLTSAEGAKRLCALWRRTPATAAPDERFASAVFERFVDSPLPIEVMGALSLRERGAWQPVVLNSRRAIAIDDCLVYVPERRELAALLRRFGRAKDMQRARLL